MNNDYLTREDRLLFLQSKHDKTDGAFLIVVGSLFAIEVIAQVVIKFFQ